jgi:hypothetical protein
MARVLVLLPARDFDPSEAAVGWRVLANAGHTISFATADGRPAVADEMMVTGKGLDPWGAIPLLRNLPLVGLLMRANRDARKAYAEMTVDPNYVAPQRWDATNASAFYGLPRPLPSSVHHRAIDMKCRTSPPRSARWWRWRRTRACASAGRLATPASAGPIASNCALCSSFSLL